MPKMYRNRTLAFNCETNYGTAETLTAADVVSRVNDPVLKIVATPIARDKSDGTLGSDKGARVGKSTSLTFWNFARGDGTSGDPAWAARLLPCVGMPSPSANTYATSGTTANWKGLSTAQNRDGKRRLGRGMMGDLTMTLEASKPFRFDWNFIGGFASNPTDTTQLSGITFEEVMPPIFAGASALTIDSSTGFKISKMVIKLNNQPWARPDANATGGFIGGWLKNPKPTIEIDPEAVTIATKDWDDFYDDATQFTIVAVANGGTGNTVTITCTNCEVNKPADDEDRNDILVDALGINVNGTVTAAFT